MANWYQGSVMVLNRFGAPVLLPVLRRPSASLVASQHPSNRMAVTDHFVFRGEHASDIEAANVLAAELVRRYSTGVVHFDDDATTGERHWRVRLVVDGGPEPATVHSTTVPPHPPEHVMAQTAVHRLAQLVIPRMRR